MPMTERQLRFVKQNWKFLSGDNGWCRPNGGQNLLAPLDNNLRSYIMHYGDMAQSTYDAFDKTDGCCLFSKDELFCKVGLKSHSRLYSITEYFSTHAALLSYDCHLTSYVNWAGYVAVASDQGAAILGRRKIVICWRGTIQIEEWRHNLNRRPEGVGNIIRNCSTPPRVHSGWLSMYTNNQFTKSAREQVTDEVRRLVDLYTERGEQVSITVTGHSLGASLALLNAGDIVTNGLNRGCPVTVFAFAPPRVGNPAFCRALSDNPFLAILRVENKNDVVPKVPAFGYGNVGHILKVDTTMSRYVDEPDDYVLAHNLEVYLHGVAGVVGDGSMFNNDLAARVRDIKLLNKHKKVLKDRFGVQVAWWHNRKEDGSYPGR